MHGEEYSPTISTKSMGKTGFLRIEEGPCPLDHRNARFVSSGSRRRKASREAAGAISRRSSVSGSTLTAVLVVLSLIAGVGAIYMVVDVGHSGAKATWNEVGNDEGADD